MPKLIGRRGRGGGRSDAQRNTVPRQEVLYTGFQFAPVDVDVGGHQNRVCLVTKTR